MLGGQQLTLDANQCHTFETFLSNLFFSPVNPVLEHEQESQSYIVGVTGSIRERERDRGGNF